MSLDFSILKEFECARKREAVVHDSRGPQKQRETKISGEFLFVIAGWTLPNLSVEAKLHSTLKHYKVRMSMKIFNYSFFYASVSKMVVISPELIVV